MVNVGQLARERWGEQVVIAGYSSYAGSVIAGQQWGAPMQRMPVPEAREGSWKRVFHDAGAQDKLVMVEELDEAQGGLDPRGHRAIGVAYNPHAERSGKYVSTVMP